VKSMLSGLALSPSGWDTGPNTTRPERIDRPGQYMLKRTQSESANANNSSPEAKQLTERMNIRLSDSHYSRSAHRREVRHQ
jgi:hypothetical protein